MKKTVIKRRKRIMPSNYTSGSHTHTSRYEAPQSTSSNSPSPPLNQRTNSPRLGNPYGPLPPLWGGYRSSRHSQSYSPENKPQDFTTYRPYNSSCGPSSSFLPSYTEQNTLPPIRLPMGHHPLSPPVPSIQHVGNAIPLPKRKMDSPELASKRLRSIGALLHSGGGAPSSPPEVDPLEGARVLLTLGSRESVIRKRAELMGEIDVLGEKLDKLKKAVGECDEFLGKDSCIVLLSEDICFKGLGNWYMDLEWNKGFLG